MPDGSVLIQRIEAISPELAQELRDYLGEDVAQSEASEFDLAESVPAGSSVATLFTEIGGEDADSEITCEATDDAGARLLERYDFIDRASGLNIPSSRHDIYTGVEREGQDPYYVVWEMPSGYSRFLSQDAIERPDATPKKENRHRYWPGEVIHSLAEQINKRRPVGYLGHADFFSMSQLPENIPVQWERAVRAKRKSDGVDVTLARGYVYDNGMNRVHLKTGAIDSASVFTVGTNELDTTDKGTEDHPVVHVKSAALISFDFVRKHNHGIPRTKMVQDLPHKEQSVRTAEERAAIASASVEEIRSLNPDAVAALETAQPNNAALEEARAYHRTAVSEALANSRAAATVAQLAERLGCEANDLFAQVEGLFVFQQSAISEAITVHVSTLKGEALRETIRTRLTERKFAKPSDVKTAFDAEISAMHDISKQMASENSIGAVSGNDVTPSGENLVSSEWTV